MRRNGWVALFLATVIGLALLGARTTAQQATPVASPAAPPEAGFLVCPAPLATAEAGETQNEDPTGNLTRGIDDRFEGWQELLIPSMSGTPETQALSVRTTTFDFDGEV